MIVATDEVRMGKPTGSEGKRKRSLTPLGETEMEVLHHVWDLEQATVADVHDRMTHERKVAYTTVMTVMKKLAKKGFLNVDDSAPSYVYAAGRSPDEVRGSLVDNLVEKVFHGSPSALVQALVHQEDLSDEERDEIKRLVDSLPKG
jgi:BlaI family transcriptional regulator, penicillinase repressor